MITAVTSFPTPRDPVLDTNLIHVLLVVDQFPETLGGGERIVLRLAALLPKYGYRTSILTFGIHPKSNVADSAPCPIYVLPLRRTYDFHALRAAFLFRKFIRSQQIQIVQTFFESSDIWAGFVTKTLSSAKLIWSRRDMGILRGRKHQAAYKLMRQLPDAVFAVSDRVRRYCIEVDQIDPARVFTVYNGLDLSGWKTTFQPIDASSKLRVKTVGNIRQVKGHDILIRAVATLVTTVPNISVMIAGEVLEPDYFADLEALIQQLNIGGVVQFVGGISDIQTYLADADIFVLPSRSEGFSNALIEAMAAGLPIVATDVGGNAEAVTDGVTGLLVPAQNVEKLAEAISRLAHNSEMASSMGRAGRAAAEEKFATAAMMGKTVEVYKRLLESDTKMG